MLPMVEVDLGEVPMNGRLSRDIHLDNPTTQTLFFQGLDGTCGCSELGVKSVLIQPNSSAVVPMRFDLRGRTEPGIIFLTGRSHHDSVPVPLARITYRVDPTSYATASWVKTESVFTPGLERHLEIVLPEPKLTLERYLEETTFDQVVGVDYAAEILDGDYSEPSLGKDGEYRGSAIVLVARVHFFSLHHRLDGHIQFAIPSNVAGTTFVTRVAFAFHSGIIIQPSSSPTMEVADGIDILYVANSSPNSHELPSSLDKSALSRLLYDQATVLKHVGKEELSPVNFPMKVAFLFDGSEKVLTLHRLPEPTLSEVVTSEIHSASIVERSGIPIQQRTSESNK